MDFDLSVTSVPPDAVLALRGELDLASSPVLAERLRDEIAGGCRAVTLDLSEVTFVDASALGTLTLTRRKLDDVQGSLTFVGYRPAFVRICRATGLADHFGLDDPDDALATA